MVFMELKNISHDVSATELDRHKNKLAPSYGFALSQKDFEKLSVFQAKNHRIG